MPAVKAARRAPGRQGHVRPAHRLGAHLSIAGGMHRALETAQRLGMDTVQVFVKNQRQWRAAPLRPDDLGRWHELRGAAGFGPALAHASYLINLASADERLWARSCRALAEELGRCDTLGIRYLVLHPGAAGHQPPGRAQARVARALNRVLERRPAAGTLLLLETTAGQGTTLGSSFAELAGIIARLRRPQSVGVCIDTCHVFAAGHDLRDPDGYAAMVASATRELGLERIRCWHLNDSKTGLGSRVDRHEHIGRGRIGSPGFRNLLADPRFGGLPMILETPKGRGPGGVDWDLVNLRRLRSLAARVQR